MPDLIYNVKFNIEDNLQQGVAGAERFEQEIKDLEQEVLQLRASLEAAGEEAGQLGNKTKGTTSNLGAMNKQTAIGNQLFFSLSDGLQDSAQFSQGFSTGMRAIGNNIGFTAELGAIFLQQVKEQNKGMLTFRKVASAAGKSLMGPGGFILAVNAAVLIISSLSRKQDEASKKAKELASEMSGKLKSSLDEYVNVMLAADGSTISLNDALEGVQQELDKNLISMNSLTRATNSNVQATSQATIGQRMLAEANQLQTTTSSAAQNVTNMNIVANTKFLGITDEIREALSEKIEKEIESNKVNELFLELLKEINPEYETYTEQVESVSSLVTEKNAREVDAALGTNLAQMSQAEFNRAVQQAVIDVQSLNVTTEERIRLLKLLMSLTDDTSEGDSARIAAARADREAQAVREIRLLRAENESDERARLESVKQARTQNLEERIQELKEKGEEEALTESEIRLEKLRIEKEYNDGINDLRDESLKREQHRKKAELELIKEQANARRQALMQGLSDVGALLNAAFGEDKKTAIASAVVSAYASAQEAYENALKGGFPPPLAKISAVAAFGASMARVQKMRSIQPGTSGGGSGDSGGTSGVSVSDASMADRFGAQGTRQRQAALRGGIVRGGDLSDSNPYIPTAGGGGPRSAGVYKVSLGISGGELRAFIDEEGSTQINNRSLQASEVA